MEKGTERPTTEVTPSQEETVDQGQANPDGSDPSHQTRSQQSSLRSDPAFSQFFEHYTPPDPCNPFDDIIKDYVDWYVNVFMTREQREHWSVAQMIDFIEMAEQFKSKGKENIREAATNTASASTQTSSQQTQ